MTRYGNPRCFTRIFLMAARTAAVITLTVATCASGATFFGGTPRTTCANSFFGNNLVITANAAGDSFSVSGRMGLQVNPGAAPCFIEWEVESPFMEVAGIYTNTSSFSGFVTSTVAGFDVKFTETTEHEDEAGTGVATAQVGAFAVLANVNNFFGAGPVNGAPFADGPGNDTLRQDFLINITPPAGGGDLLFDFPVSSATAAPEPTTLSLFAAGSLLIAVGCVRKRKRAP